MHQSRRNQRDDKDDDAPRGADEPKRAAPLIKAFMADIDSDEPLFDLMAQNSLEKFDQRMADLIEFAATTYVSAEVRDECVAELEAAKKNKYRIS